jgi:HPt (histidine-containing phosphotransfer) domain-containing protein
MPRASGGNGYSPNVEPGAPPLDVEAALPRFGGDMGFFVEMFREFVPQLQERLAELRAAQRAGDADTLARVAHNLKGLSASFSADHLTAATRKLEKAGRASDLSGAPALIDEIEAQIPVMAAYLEQLEPARA